MGNFEEETKESNRRSDQADCDIRDYGKKVHGLEIEFDETCDKLQKATESLEEKEKMYREVEGDVSALSRRKLGVQEDELKRAIERAELAENKLKSIEEELQLVGENMKSLETSAEKAVEREEKLKEKILSIQRKYKAAEDRFEYGEMSITKLNQKIDNIED